MSLNNHMRVHTAHLLEKAFGPVILSYMRNREVEDIHINANDTVYVQYAGRSEKLDITVSSDDRNAIIGYAGTLIGTKADGVKTFVVDGKLPSGQRFHGVIEPRALRGPYIVMRNPPWRIITLGEYVDRGVMTQEIADFLEDSVRRKATMLINGETGSGKTSLLTCLLNLDGARYDRIATCEDAEEINTNSIDNLVPKTTIGGTMQDLVFDAMRERPDRVIIGELRDKAAYDWIKVVEAGCRGSMATIHASYPNRVMGRLERLVAEAGVNPEGLRPTLYETVDLIVSVIRYPDGRRVIPGIYKPVQKNCGKYEIELVCGEVVQAIM